MDDWYIKIYQYWRLWPWAVVPAWWSVCLAYRHGDGFSTSSCFFTGDTLVCSHTKNRFYLHQILLLYLQVVGGHRTLGLKFQVLTSLKILDLQKIPEIVATWTSTLYEETEVTGKPFLSGYFETQLSWSLTLSVYLYCITMWFLEQAFHLNVSTEGETSYIYCQHAYFFFPLLLGNQELKRIKTFIFGSGSFRTCCSIDSIYN